jgi:hypothetical protein
VRIAQAKPFVLFEIERKNENYQEKINYKNIQLKYKKIENVRKVKNKNRKIREKLLSLAV